MKRFHVKSDETIFIKENYLICCTNRKIYFSRVENELLEIIIAEHVNGKIVIDVEFAGTIVYGDRDVDSIKISGIEIDTKSGLFDIYSDDFEFYEGKIEIEEAECLIVN